MTPDMIGWHRRPLVLAVVVIGLTDYACAGSIRTSHHIHHNPVHLSLRKICCCLQQSDSCWDTFVFVNHMDPPKLAINEKKQSSKRRLGNLSSCLGVDGFSRSQLSCSLTLHDYCIHSMEEVGWFIFVYSNKQRQCSGLWQTLNWIASVINKLLLTFCRNEARGKQISSVAVASFP